MKTKSELHFRFFEFLDSPFRVKFFKKFKTREDILRKCDR